MRAEQPPASAHYTTPPAGAAGQVDKDEEKRAKVEADHSVGSIKMMGQMVREWAARNQRDKRIRQPQAVPAATKQAGRGGRSSKVGGVAGADTWATTKQEAPGTPTVQEQQGGRRSGAEEPTAKSLQEPAPTSMPPK